ncbi:MAG TPA: histidine phosphatase family protein [Candidatus Sulfotelmatobacter sp.]|nr:histidine phosphatase family protein [Candidatus Sulfotelmatobacter sp.]
MLTVVLTRHGGTTRSTPEQHLGQHLDVPLSDAGRAQAAALGRRLAGVAFERVVSSPLQRAVETARLVVPGREPELDRRLLEMDYGAWEGLTYEQIAARDGPARLLWEADPASLACPGGESGHDVAVRVRAFLEAAIEAAEPDVEAAQADAAAGADAEADHRILVVAHSSTDRILLCVALGVPVRDYRRRFAQAPANLTVLRFPGGRGGGAKALLLDDVGHLRGLSGATWD